MTRRVLVGVLVTAVALVAAAATVGARAVGPVDHTIYLAVSKDGLTWTRVRKILDKASVPTAVPEGTGFRVYYVDGSPGGTTECADVVPQRTGGSISVATWKKARVKKRTCTFPTTSALPKVWDPSALRTSTNDKVKHYVYYYASSGDANDVGEHQIRLAYSLSGGLTFITPVTVFTYEAAVDPDVWKFGTRWLMYVYSGTANATIVAEGTVSSYSDVPTSFTYVGPLSPAGYGTTAPVAIGPSRYRMYAFDQPDAKTIVSFTASAARGGLPTWTKESGTRLTAKSGEKITDPFVVKLQNGTWAMVFKSEPR